jgi:O-antigen/teichoic acid export membrane protein
MAIATPTTSSDTPAVNPTLVKRVAWNTATNYAARFFGIAVGLVLTPFILREIGPASYGLWALIGSVTGYGALLDLGISSALIKYVAEYRAKQDYVQARRVVATALWVFSGLGLVVIALSALVAPLFPGLFHVADADRDMAAWLVFLAMSGIGLWLPCSTTGAVLRGLHRFDLVNLLQVVTTLMNAVGTVVILLGGGGLLGLIVLNNAVMLVLQIPAILMIRRAEPRIGYSPRGASRGCVALLVRFSAWVFVVNVAGRMQNKTDEVVIGARLPVASVTPYALANGLSDVALMLTDQFIKLLLPLASELHAGGDPRRLRELYLTSTRLAMAVFASIAATLAFLAGPILAAWVGTQYSEYAYLVVILLVADAASASQWPAGAVLQAMTRYRVLSLVAVGSAVVNLCLSVVLLQWIGLAGVALGTLIPTVIASFGIALPFTMRVLGATTADLVKEVVGPVGLPLVPLLGTVYLLDRWIQPHTLPALFVVAVVSLATYAVAYICVGASSFERASYRQLARGMAALVLAQVSRVTSA